MRTEARGIVTVPPESGSVPPSRYIAFTLLVLLGVSWDLGTKQYVFDTLGLPGRSEWEWRAGDIIWFTLQTNLNYGALWGLGQGWAGLFAALSVVAIVGVLFFLFWLQHARSWWLTIALGLVLSGAVGNLYDRLGWHGLLDPRTGERAYAVRDFLYFRFFETFDWAIFNYADTYLVTGAIMLMIHSLKSDPVTVPPSQPSDPKPSVA